MEIVPQGGKYCPGCKCCLDLVNFYKNKSAKDGYCGYCKPCWKIINEKSLLKNIDTARASRRAQSRKFRAGNPEIVKVRQAAWYARNKDYFPKWRASNPEKPKEANRRRYWKDPEKSIQSVLGRSAKRRGADVGSHTLDEWRSLCVKFNNRCVACNGKKKLTRDHIVPITQGGTDFISNIQPLCGSCNSRKNNRYVNYRYDRLLTE